MASYLLRRSGIAVGLIAEQLHWQADVVYQVGIGHEHKETEVLSEEWPGVKFIGCEPHPGICKGLKGKYPGKLYQVAIADQVGATEFYIKTKHADGSSLFHLEDKGGVSREAVKTETLDHLFPEPEGKHILLWLDCEGSELGALQGGRGFIKRVEVVNVELTANPPCKEWSSPVAVNHWLQECGFLLQHIHTHRISASQCDCVYVRESLFDPKFCCVPSEIERFDLLKTWKG